MGYVWSDRERRFFVSTVGSLVQGALSQRVRWTEVGDKDDKRLAKLLLIEVPVPFASEVFFYGCGMIDSHNRI